MFNYHLELLVRITNKHFINCYFLVFFSGHYAPCYSPINDRIRKRRAFADQDLMETTLTNYYMHMTPPTTSYPALNYSRIETSTKHIKVEADTQTRPKISFSIESIIGIKWKFWSRGYCNCIYLYFVICTFLMWELKIFKIGHLLRPLNSYNANWRD